MVLDEVFGNRPNGTYQWATFFTLMGYTAYAGGATRGQLAKATGILPVNVSRALAGLQKTGLVEQFSTAKEGISGDTLHGSEGYLQGYSSSVPGIPGDTPAAGRDYTLWRVAKFKQLLALMSLKPALEEGLEEAKAGFDTSSQIDSFFYKVYKNIRVSKRLRVRLSKSNSFILRNSFATSSLGIEPKAELPLASESSRPALEVAQVSLTSEPLSAPEASLASESPRPAPEVPKTPLPSESRPGPIMAPNPWGPSDPDWFTETDFRRLERRLPKSSREFNRVRMEEAALLVKMWAGYAKNLGTDAFLRTLEFAYAYEREFLKQFPKSSCRGKGKILGERVTDSKHWASLVAGRRAADMDNAHYDDWCHAVFQHYKHNPIHGMAIPTPAYFKSAKAQEFYLGHKIEKYEGKPRDIKNPVWTPDEFDPSDPAQVNHWLGLIAELEWWASFRAKGVWVVMAEAILDGALPEAALERYAPQHVQGTLVAKAKEEEWRARYAIRGANLSPAETPGHLLH